MIKLPSINHVQFLYEINFPSSFFAPGQARLASDDAWTNSARFLRSFVQNPQRF